MNLPASDIRYCLIWPEIPADVDCSTVTDNATGADFKCWKVDSPRAGGTYRVKDEMEVIRTLKSLDDDGRARLTTLLVDLRNQGDEMPWVIPELLERARRAQPLDADERAERLLRFIRTRSSSISDGVVLDWMRPTTADDFRALAWSESASVSDTHFLLKYLKNVGWIETYSNVYRVTVDGYRRLAEIRTNLDSGQAFVAMWFDDETNDAYKQGIKPAIRAAGFKPMRIDQKQDVVKIDDAIIAEIRRSRFLVADFTHGKDGARGGVYFEAGFAFGLNIPVIYLCRNDSIDKIHFDTRQYHHITWSSPERLRTDLKNRILALIGEGPVRSGV